MRIKNGFFMREVAGKYVVVPVGAQTNEFKGMIQMNQTGAFLWKALERDLTEEALLSIGAEILFHGIAIKPGMPTLAAEKDGVLFIGLSGNPFSAAIPFEMFVREILSLKMGDPDLKLRRETLTAVTGFSKNSRRRRFLRGKAEGKEVWLPDQQANGQMRSMVGCNCLIEIPAGSGPVKAGDKVEVLWL